MFSRRLQNPVRVDQPVVLIAPRLARSGGSLLLQLLDSHPQLHVRPHELRVGRGRSWPELDPRASAEELFERVRDHQVDRSFRDGYYHKDRPARKLGYETEGFPMVLPPDCVRRLFCSLLERNRPKRARDVFDTYFTAYFNAWLDNRNLHGDRRWVVAFRAKLGTAENVDAFFADYPDGRHISLVRDAKGWVASRVTLRGRRDGDLTGALDLWMEAVAARLVLKGQLGDSMALISFEQLVRETEDVMRGLAAWLEVSHDSQLLQPTFNGMPIRANSSFRVSGAGVLPEVLDHWQSVLTPSETRLIAARTAELHERVLAAASF
jgi:Sulfotransferase family